MAQLTINATDTPNEGRVSINTNFTELYALVGVYTLSCTFTGTISGTTVKYSTFGSEAQLTADQIQLVFPYPNTKTITLDYLTVRNQSKSGAGVTSVTIFKNGSASSLKANCTSGAITQDTVNTAAFTGSTDRCSIALDVPSTDTVVNVAITVRVTVT